MKCPRCQHENPAGMRFRGRCAAPLASVCASCGTANPPEKKFGGQCATTVGKPTQPRFASLAGAARSRLEATAHNSLQDRRGRYTSAYETIPGTAFAARQNMEMPT